MVSSRCAGSTSVVRDRSSDWLAIALTPSLSRRIYGTVHHRRVPTAPQASQAPSTVDIRLDTPVSDRAILARSAFGRLYDIRPSTLPPGQGTAEPPQHTPRRHRA